MTEEAPAPFTRREALELLRQPLADRERQLYHGAGGILLLDDGGGEPIDCFDDVTAVFHFLRWLDDVRADRQAEAQEVAARKARRAALRVVVSDE